MLLLDDTWTSGAHAQSAAAALWAIGRHFNCDEAGEQGEASETYYRQARVLGWYWERCCLYDDRSM